MIQERGRALNEAITESLAEEVTREIYVSENIPQPIPNMEPYSEERDIMKLLQEKFGLTRDDFAKAAINRRALRPLVQKLEGLTTAEGGARERLRPEFMPLLLSIMDYEHNGRAFDYRVTRQLIDGKKDIVITKQMKRNFPNNLLDREGNIKPELVERYLLIDEEVAEKQRKAA